MADLDRFPDPALGIPRAERVARRGEPPAARSPRKAAGGGKTSSQPSERQAARMPSPVTGAERLSSQGTTPVRGRPESRPGGALGADGASSDRSRITAGPSLADLRAAAMSEAPLFDATPDLTVMRRCSGCGELKPLAVAFKKRNNGYRFTCKTCENASRETRRKRRGPEHLRIQTQWRFYRIRQHDYEEILRTQGGVCGLCRKPFAKDPRLIHVDHDHKCDHPGKGAKCCRACVRGILCHRCNIFVGWIENDYRRLADLFNYLGVDGVVMWAHIMRDIGYEALLAGELEFARQEP